MGFDIIVREKRLPFSYGGCLKFEEMSGITVPLERMSPKECNRLLKRMREYDMEEIPEDCRATVEGIMALLEHSVKTRCHFRVNT